MMKQKAKVNQINLDIFLLYLGTYEYKDGRKYEGQFKNNQKHGKGVYNHGIKGHGLIYDGYFVNGIKEGQGKLTW